MLNGEIGVPLRPRGVVVFPRIGTSRIDACSHRVRQELQQVGFATVVVDLLLRGGESSGARARSERAGPELLGNRLAIVTDWARRNPAIRLLPIGYFGATSAMASVLVAAVRRADLVRGIVLCSGHAACPSRVLQSVRAPTLFIVGEYDTQLIKSTQAARRKLEVTSALEIVPGATRFLEEPSAGQAVSDLARNWFSGFLKGSALAWGTLARW